MLKEPFRRIFRVSIVIIFIIGSSTTIYTNLLGNSRAQAEAKLEQETIKLQSLLQNRLDIYTNVIDSAEAFFANSNYVSKDEFYSYFNNIDLASKYSGISGILYIENIKKDEVADVEQTVTNDISTTTENNGEFKIRTESEKEEYNVIKYIQPYNPTSTSLGLDLNDNQPRRDAIELARDTGLPTTTGKIALLGSATNIGFLIYVPIYKNGEAIDTVENRRKAFTGVLNGAFRVDTLFEGVFGDSNEYKDVNIEIYSGDSVNNNNLLFSSNDIGNKTNIITKEVQLPVANQNWTMRFRSMDDYGLSYLEKTTPTNALFTLAFLELLVFSLIYFLINSRDRATLMAENMTKQLRQSEQTMKSIIEGVNVILFSFDMQGKFTLSEGKSLASIGVKPGQLVGIKVKDAYKDYPEVMQDIDRALKGEEFTVTRKIKDIIFEVSYTSIKKNDELVGVIGVAVDVSERVTSKDKLEARTSELERLNKVMVDRELKMIELKNEIKRLTK